VPFIGDEGKFSLHPRRKKSGLALPPHKANTYLTFTAGHGRIQMSPPGFRDGWGGLGEEDDEF
jgi:hypothetical protein